MKHATHSQCLFAAGAILLMPIALIMVMGLDDMEITCSLYHNNKLEYWWPQNSWKFPNITLEEFGQFPFPEGLTQLDAQFVNASPKEIQVGDIMAFETFSEPPKIAHRVIRKWAINKTETEITYVDGFLRFLTRNVTKYYFSTVGDNAVQMPYERKIEGRQVLGRMEKGERGFSSVISRLTCD